MRDRQPRDMGSVVWCVLGMAWGVGGCSSCEPGPAPAASVSVTQSAAPAPPPMPPSEHKPATFSSEDGAALAGDLHVPRDPAAAALVLIHRLSADRSEWKPLVERLTRSSKRYTVLAFDLRGHGVSKAPPKAKSEVPPEAYLADVRAGVKYVLEMGGPKPSGVVLVGSSLGAALISKVAWDEPRVTALGLVSPGAAIQGMDIYRPYAEVRNLPTFLASATDDNVSREPSDALSKMAMSGTIKSYQSSMHSAGWVGDKHPELWQDLEDWLMSVHDAKLQERRSLYYAPGKEPAARGKEKKKAVLAPVGVKKARP